MADGQRSAGGGGRDGLPPATPPASDVTDLAPVAEAALGDSSGLRALVERSRQRVSTGQTRLNELIEKYQDRPLLDVILRILQRDREGAGTLVASALAFRLFLFFVPLTLFVVGVVGVLASWFDLHELNNNAGLSGALAEQMNTALSQPNSTRWIAIVAGFSGMAWAGRSLSRVLVASSCLAWRLPVITKASLRVIGSVAALLIGMVFVWAVVNRVRRDLGVGVASLSFVAALAIYALAWMAMSMLLPRATRDPSALLPGAVLVGAVLAGMQALAQLYLPDKLGRASALYGAIGTTVVTLGWFFFLARAMVFGMSLDAVIYERFGSISQFVFGLPLVRVLPRRSAWIRRFFDLDPHDEAGGSEDAPASSQMEP
jgi:uncharacterized BrkB/YihY/UPF0761 family membrane protein